MSKEKPNIIAALDVGTSKVALSFASVSGSELKVLSLAQANYQGMHQGEIVDTKGVEQALHKVKAEAEAIAGQSLSQVYLSVADSQLQTVSVSARAEIRREVTQKDIQELLLQAEDSVQLRSDSVIAGIAPQLYFLDGSEYVQAPIGEHGDMLEVSAVITTMSRKNLQLVESQLEKMGVSVRSSHQSSFASAFAVTTVSERQQGVVVVDIGHSVTEIVAFKRETVCFSTALPVGGVNFTQDLAVGLRTPQLQAEQIKKQFGSALIDLVDGSAQIEVQSLRGDGSSQVAQTFICEILEARAEETLGLVLKQLCQHNLHKDMPAGVVITGGGSSLNGLLELAKHTFDVPLRKGVPVNLSGLGAHSSDPGLSSCWGLLQYARKRHSFEPIELSIDTLKSKWARLKNLIDNIL